MNDLPDKHAQRDRLDRLDAEPDILTALAERVAEGVSLVDVAHDYGVSLRRLGKWLEDPGHPERLREWDFARRCYADKLAQETVAIADEQKVAFGRSGEPYDPDVARDTLRVNTRFKAAAKLDRARWGEKIELNAHLSVSLDVLLGRVETMLPAVGVGAVQEARPAIDVTPERVEAASTPGYGEDEQL